MVVLWVVVPVVTVAVVRLRMGHAGAVVVTPCLAHPVLLMGRPHGDAAPPWSGCQHARRLAVAWLDVGEHLLCWLPIACSTPLGRRMAHPAAAHEWPLPLP